MDPFLYIALLSPEVLSIFCLILSFGLWGNVYRLAFQNKKLTNPLEIMAFFPSRAFLKASLLFYAFFSVFFFLELGISPPVFQVVMFPILSLSLLYWLKSKNDNHTKVVISSLLKEFSRYFFLALSSFIILTLLGTLINMVLTDELVLHSLYSDHVVYGRNHSPVNLFRQFFLQYPFSLGGLTLLYFTLPVFALRPKINIYSMHFLSFSSVALALFLVPILFENPLAFPDYPSYFSFSSTFASSYYYAIYLAYLFGGLLFVTGFFYLWHFQKQRNKLKKVLVNSAITTQEQAPSTTAFLFRSRIPQTIIISIAVLIELYIYFKTAFPCSTFFVEHVPLGFHNISACSEKIEVMRPWGDWTYRPYEPGEKELFLLSQEIRGFFQSFSRIFVSLTLGLWSYIYFRIFSSKIAGFEFPQRLVPPKSTIQYCLIIPLSLICYFLISIPISSSWDYFREIRAIIFSSFLWFIPIAFYKRIVGNIHSSEKPSAKEKKYKFLDFLAIACLGWFLLQYLSLSDRPMRYIDIRYLLLFFSLYMSFPFLILFKKFLSGLRWKYAKQLLSIFSFVLIFLLFGLTESFYLWTHY